MPSDRVDQVWVGTSPGVVHHVGTCPAHHVGDLGTPGVDAEHQVGEALPGALDDGHDPGQLLGEVDLGSRPCLYPADVDDVGALIDQGRDPVERQIGAERQAMVDEGVRGDVDDRHDGQVGRSEVPLSPSQVRRLRRRIGHALIVGKGRCTGDTCWPRSLE
jgi:hypothetical protein